MWINEAIKPVPKNVRYKHWKIKSKRFVKELEWYSNYGWEKVTKSRFYQRLYQWWSKEEAIKVWPVTPRIRIRFTNKNKKQPYQRPITPLPTIKKQNSDIRIKYNRDEYKAFKEEYERMIDELQTRYYEAEWDEAKEIYNRLEELTKEYKTFMLYNN